MLLWLVVFGLLGIWLWGMSTDHVMGGFLHLLLIAAVVLAILRKLQGQRL